MEKIVLIGAGSAMFTRGLIRDLLERKKEVELALVDIDEDALAVAERLAQKMIELNKAPIRLTAATDRRTVMKGGTVVICTIGVGGSVPGSKMFTFPVNMAFTSPLVIV